MWAESILHVDMDSFFVEVERLSHPDLRGRPVAVGGTGARGVIASASYEARSSGVSSAQPTSVALRLCPELVVVSPSHGLYGDVSARVFAIFNRFTPRVEGLSLDEAFLDVGGLRHHFGSAVAVGEEIRNVIRDEEGLPASVGVASTKFLAKLASKAAKPDGIKRIAKATELEFLHSLPVSELWGVGPATLAGLKRLGIESVGDLAGVPVETLESSLGRSQGAHLHSLANGRDDRRVEPDTGARQISVEETYAEDLQGRDLVESAVMAHAQRLATRLRRSGRKPRTISLKVRYDDFSTITRSRTVPFGVDTAREIFLVARELLGQVPADRPVRLLGIAGSSFEEGEPDQRLFEQDEQWSRVGRALGDVEDRFGTGKVTPARLMEWRAQSEDSMDD